MKKIIALVLAGLMSVAVFAGCTSDKTVEPTPTPDPCASGHIDLVTEKGTVTWLTAGTSDKIYCKACGTVIQESQEVDAKVNIEERYNPEEPIYIVKKVEEGFSWDNIEVANINVENWKDRKGYDPETTFQVVHTNDSIIVKFVSNNDYVKSIVTETNGIVCGDACVEFFVSPSTDPEHYYNFEMNSLGTIHVGYGVEAQNRTIVDPDIIHQYVTTNAIQYPETFQTTADGERGKWEITLTIKKEFFKVVSGVEFGDGFTKGGFYKCSDLPVATKDKKATSTGHLLAWNTINTKKANQGFHTVSAFGNIAFED